MDAVTSVPVPTNEPVRGYAPGSAERESLQRRIGELEGESHELTMTIGGVSRMADGDPFTVVQPHDHEHALGSSCPDRGHPPARRPPTPPPREAPPAACS